MGCPRVVAGEQGLKFADDLLGRGFRDQVALDFQLEALLEERGYSDGSRYLTAARPVFLEGGTVISLSPPQTPPCA